jgi:hypothetical protein
VGAELVLALASIASKSDLRIQKLAASAECRTKKTEKITKWCAWSKFGFQG